MYTYICICMLLSPGDLVLGAGAACSGGVNPNKITNAVFRLFKLCLRHRSLHALYNDIQKTGLM